LSGKGIDKVNPRLPTIRSVSGHPSVATIWLKLFLPLHDDGAADKPSSWPGIPVRVEENTAQLGPDGNCDHSERAAGS
jgi:hypothetical protein